ncbi:MAG: response regulator [Magnetococcales bacterium]|nr:response regulator [Magnetococcales bacterium]
MKIRDKIIGLFLLTGLLPLLVVAWWTGRLAEERLEKTAYDQLQSLRDTKLQEIDRYFKERVGDINVLVETIGILRKSALSKLESVQKIKKAMLLAHLQAMQKALHTSSFEEIQKDKDWHNVIVIRSDGEIVDSSVRKQDVGQNLLSGVLRDSPLGQVLKKAMNAPVGEVLMTDFAVYAPWGTTPMAFMITAMGKEKGSQAGFLAAQLSLKGINEIMAIRHGMGKTGESYLVGQDGLMRSDSFLNPKEYSMEASFRDQRQVDTEAVRLGLQGKSGNRVTTDYNGNAVISAWDSVELGNGVRWVMISEMDMAEAMTPTDEQGKEFYKDYVELYGYYDLMLINPNGLLFYSTDRESDYHTNMLTGLYKNSSLGRLVQKVLIHGKTELADFAPYAPSKGEPQAFLVKPYSHDGKIEVIVVLQLSLESINRVMHEQSGLGETGEAFLVGSDKRMRSDAIRDPVGHSVHASFAGTVEKNGIDTLPVREALAGKTGILSVVDYRKEHALVAYAPVRVMELTWAMVVKIASDEIFKPVDMIRKIITSITIISILLSVVLTIWIVRSITRSLQQAVTVVDRIALGDVEQDIVISSGDEISQVLSAVKMLVTAEIGVIRAVEKLAVGNLDVRLTARSSKDLLTQSLNQLVQAEKQVAGTMVRLAEGDLTVEVESRSEEDQLLLATKSLVVALRGVTYQAKEVSEGHFEIPIVLRSDRDELSLALKEMTTSLRKAAEESRIQLWMKEGLNHLNEKLRVCEVIEDLAFEAIHFMARYLDCQVGAFYVVTGEGTLLLTAGFALSVHPGSLTLVLGEGLVGQAARDRQRFVLDSVPKEFWRVSTALGEMIPGNVVVMPLDTGQEVKGVVELGSSHPFDANVLAWLELVGQAVAVNIVMVQARQKVALLLMETQQQAEELQTQQEIVEETNQQLELQARELENSHREIEGYNSRLEISQQELEEHVQQLELSNKYKMEFLANMSHELRTPLNSILLLSQLMMNDSTIEQNEDQRKNLQVIHNSGQDLLNLINDILDHAKIESGKITMETHSVELQDIMDYLSATFKAQMEKAGLDFVCQLDSSLPSMIQTDRNRMLQVVRNFLANSLKFTEKGYIRVDIQPLHQGLLNDAEGFGKICQTLAKQDVSDYLAISVSDTGIGIPEDKRQLVFEAFQQVSGAINRKYSGTGLGLAISLKIAEALGGGILLRSTVNQGSCFSLLLPLKTMDRVSHESVEKPAFIHVPPKPFPTKPVITGQRLLLVVEDDDEFAEILSNQAKRMHYEMIRAVSGTEALRLAIQNQPDAILLDIHLPVMDGWEVLRQLKKNARTRHIPVHILSGDDERQFGFKLGAMGYLVKPVQAEELQHMFKKLEDHYTLPERKLLVVADVMECTSLQQLLLGGDDIVLKQATTGPDAMAALSQEHYDCIVIDMNLSDRTAFTILEQLNTGNLRIPTVVCTKHELTFEMEKRLRRFADSIVLKTAETPSRLLEETSIFLHRKDEQMNDAQRTMLNEWVAPEKLLENKTILLVDDDIRNTYAMSAALEHKGLNVVSANDGLEALALLEEGAQTFDLILMDIMMPEMDGFETTRRIRAMKSFQTIPIIAVTAKAMVEDREESMRAGASDYLTKPVDYDQLFSLIRIWLAASKASNYSL